MRRYKFILLMLVASLAWSCQRDDLESYESDNEISYGNVEVLEDGRIKVTTSLERLGMTSIETRASSIEDNIYNGWCLVFGKTNGGTNITDADTDGYGYGDDSPLIQLVPITANANGTFFMTFEPFDDRAYMRIIVNMTDRENQTLEKDIVSWRDLAADNEELDEITTPSHSVVEQYRDNYNLATFGQFRHQSVGLDGIYNIDYKTTVELRDFFPNGITDYSGETVYYSVYYATTGSSNTGKNYITELEESYNDISPNPSTQLNTTKGFPMASYGFVMENLSEETLANAFGTTIDMIRVCSKVVVDVSEASGFEMQEVRLIDAPQESRIRSTVLSTVSEDEDGDPSVTSSFSLPVDLGGLITYEAMPVSGSVSDPIYFYPNSGGNYSYTGAVDQDINPQYIIIKGQAAGYDTPGYYKVALKAQYPLINGADPDQMDDTDQWSQLTYDILRNTSFTVKITDIDKPGYKTFEDAADVNSPANNISYSITIEVDNSHYETLVSKGTYHVELAASRVYAKGYGTEGIYGDNVYVDFTMYPTTDNTVPTVYVQSSDYDDDNNTDCVEITGCKVLRDGDEYYSSEDWDKVTAIYPETNTYDDFANNIVVIPSSDQTTKVRVYFKATDSGRIRLRIGDILKFIPVVYEATAIKIEGESPLTITDNYGTTWNNFAYNQDSDIEITLQTSGGVEEGNWGEDKRILQSSGSTLNNTGNYENLELHTRVYTSDNSGIAQLYLRQASDFVLYTSYDNSAESATGGTSGTNDIFSTPVVSGLTSTYTASISYQSNGKVYQVNDVTKGTLDSDNIMTGWTIGNAPITVTTYGEFETSLSGAFTTVFTLDDWSNLSNGATPTTVTIDASDIGTNQTGSTYDSDKAEEHNDVVLTLTNIANQSKVYNLSLAQYARPYISDTRVTYDATNNIYNWTCDLIADISSAWFGSDNVGSYTNSPTVYNARYRSGAEGEGDWSYSEASASGGYTGGSTGVTRITKVFNVVSVPDTQGDPTTSSDYYFKITVVDYGATYVSTNYQAYFDLKMSNGASERIFFRILLRRDDDLNP